MKMRMSVSTFRLPKAVSPLPARSSRQTNVRFLVSPPRSGPSQIYPRRPFAAIDSNDRHAPLRLSQGQPEATVSRREGHYLNAGAQVAGMLQEARELGSVRRRNEQENLAHAGSDDAPARKRPIFSIACDSGEWAERHIEAPRAAR